MKILIQKAVIKLFSVSTNNCTCTKPLVFRNNKEQVHVDIDNN